MEQTDATHSRCLKFSRAENVYCACHKVSARLRLWKRFDTLEGKHRNIQMQVKASDKALYIRRNTYLYMQRKPQNFDGPLMPTVSRFIPTSAFFQISNTNLPPPAVWFPLMWVQRPRVPHPSRHILVLWLAWGPVFPTILYSSYGWGHGWTCFKGNMAYF